MPDSSDGLLDWSAVEGRLTAAPQYWMATTRPDNRPHAVPRWGVWIDGRFWQAVIVEGTSQPAAPPGVELGARLAAAFADKYADRGYEPKADSWEGPAAVGLRVLTPTKALAWFDFPTDVTRFHFTL